MGTASMAWESWAVLEAPRWGSVGNGRQGKRTCWFTLEQAGSNPGSEPSVKAMGMPRGGGDPDTGLARFGCCVFCPLASLSVVASSHLVSPSSRLYLSLVLGNVNVTLLSKQAK